MMLRDAAMDDVAVRVSVVAYAASEAGAVLLLRRGQMGEYEVCTAEEVCRDDQTGATAAELLCSSLPSLMIAATTESSDPAGVTAMLTARISLGVGVHTVSAPGSKLVLVPVRHQAVPDEVKFDWVSAAQLVAPSPAGSGTAAAVVLNGPPSMLLLSPTGRVALATIISKTGRAQPAAPQEHQAVDPTIPRKLQQGLFLGEMATVCNEDLLRMLGITQVLIVHDQDKDLSNPSTSNPVAEQVAAAVQVCARLRASAWVLEVESHAATDGNAKSLLEEACLWILQGMDEGCILVAGELSKLRASAVWVASALLAATAALPERKGSRRVPKAFARCRALFPKCRMSVEQALEAEEFAASFRPPRRGPCSDSSSDDETGDRRVRRQGGPARGVKNGSGSRWLREAREWLFFQTLGAHSPADQAVIHAHNSAKIGGEPADASVLQTDSRDTAQLEERPSVSSATAPAAGQGHAPPSTAAHNMAVLSIQPALSSTAAGVGEIVAPSRSGYKCAKCRAMLFSANILEMHEQGGGQASFKPRRRGADPQQLSCTSHFLRSDAATNLDQIEGKLCCPKCKSRIGNFHWAGMQCSCGAWVTPAVQVVKSKVDEYIFRTG